MIGVYFEGKLTGNSILYPFLHEQSTISIVVLMLRRGLPAEVVFTQKKTNSWKHNSIMAKILHRINGVGE